MIWAIFGAIVVFYFIGILVAIIEYFKEHI